MSHGLSKLFFVFKSSSSEDLNPTYLQIVELTANTEANQGRIFFTCPSHEKGGSGCDFWYWEEGYIKYLNRKGLIEQNTCAKLLNEANQREMQRGTEEIKLDADVKKKSTVQEIRKDADVEEFKQADHMLLILREMMVMMKLMLVGGVCSVGLIAKPYCVGLQCAMRCETFEMSKWQPNIHQFCIAVSHSLALQKKVSGEKGWPDSWSVSHDKLIVRMPDWCSGSNFKHRWGGVRFKRTMLELKPDQKKFIIDNGFESFLSLSNFKVHSRLAEWIMQKMNPEICEFRFRGKVIVFDKLLVQKITGLNDGDLPVKLSGANSEVVKEIRTLYHPYFVSNRLGTGMCEKLLLSLHDEEKFLRTFILYLLATILCPATGNYVNLDYLHSLVDVKMCSQYDWCTHVASCLMREIRKYQGFSTEQRDSIFQIGECLPLLVIAYMDHLQMPTTGLHLRIIDYNTPRFCHVTDEDFEYVAVVDRCRMNLGYVTYGSRPFHPRNEITYLAQVHAVVGGSEAENAGVARAEDVPIGAVQDGVGIRAAVAQDSVAQDSASLNEWIRLSASSSQGTTFSASLKSIIEKHSAMWQDEFVSALDNFKRDMIDLPDSNTAVGISEAVSNPPSTGLAAEVVSNTPSTEGVAEAVSKPSSIEGAAKATDFDGPSKEASGGSVPSSPAIDDYIFASHSDISNLDDACDAPSFRLFNESDPDFISTQDLAVEMLSLDVSNDTFSITSVTCFCKDIFCNSFTHCKDTFSSPPFTHCNKNINFSSSLSSSSKGNIPSYIFTATCYKLATSSSGPSTHEKKNRKKRARKGDSDVEAKKLKTTSEIDDVYRRSVVDSLPNRSRKADAKELTTPFLRIGEFHVSLEYFREAMKPRGELNNEVMSCWIEMFNANCREDSKMKSSIKKFDKLICNPEKFVSESCVKWVKSINKEQKLPKLDLVTNFTKVAVDAKIPIKDISKFQTCSPPHFFSLRYIENWDGKNLQAFNEGDMPNYQKFVNHDQLQAN
uniref:Zinc finger GRF-type domain-containing protein n=1 Tax=Oryza meridionalis TaxID=40149 RepID=A0A0E0EKU9_9ORYZ